ncbi:MAG TPA: hypothetical protein VEM57_04365 [Candidatus Binatus sp.]|nr:hypothetical protein [Candidatus Binatus sp.]
MIDAALLGLLLVACAAAGLWCLRALGAAPAAESERLLAGLAVGLGLGGMAGLGLAVLGILRPAPIALLGAVALAGGGRELGRVLRAVDLHGARRAWPLVAVCALVLAAELAAMVAPPVGGDQTKYQLVYPRLYAAHGGLVATPWSFWGQMQYLPNFLFAIGYALRGEVLARLVNGALGVLAALSLATLVRRHLAPRAGAAAGALFFTLPITWSLMTRAGSDLAVVLYAASAVTAFLDWREEGRAADLRRAAVMAGLAGGSKVMGLLVPGLLGIGVLAVLGWRAVPVRRGAVVAVGFGVLVLLFASPWYARNTHDTGNPIYPFGYGVFGGRNWSSAASEYLNDYYRQYQTVQAVRRDGMPYIGLDVARFPWDLTMHSDSFEHGARQSMEVGPFALAFAPALLLVRRRRTAVLAAAAFGLGYAGIIAGGMWAHPRYVFPGVVLVLISAVPAARAMLRPRLFTAVVALTIAGHVAVITRLLQPMWPDQVRVALGRLAPEEFLRRHSARFAFWERANAEVPPSGLVLVLEKNPHPYYIERPFMLGSYLEQGMVDYREVATPDALASVARLWRSFLGSECESVLREGGFGLYALRAGSGATALASPGLLPHA